MNLLISAVALIFALVSASAARLFAEKVNVFSDIRTSLSGEIFRNISKCNQTIRLSPNNIHVLMMGSRSYLTEYQLQLHSAQEYCKLHGYHFSAEDPEEVYRKFGTIRADGGHNNIISSKAIFIYCKLFIVIQL